VVEGADETLCGTSMDSWIPVVILKQIRKDAAMDSEKNRGFFLMIFDDFCHTVIQFNLVVQFTPEESSTKGCESRRVTGFC
jgi:hypothetical protein